MKIAILGAGWFGCHLAIQLNKNKTIISLIEKEKDIFLGMSGFNSNRLHMGYHYPRAINTRLQCKENYLKFTRKYPELISKIDLNLIGIHYDSKINFEEYLKILKSTGLKFKLYKNKYGLNNIEGFIKCDEKLINPYKSKLFFKKEIKKVDCKLNYKIKSYSINNKSALIDKKKYDWLIDCTGCNFFKKYEFPIIYEPRITLIYKSYLNNIALMIMDGPFWSIYPLKKNYFTIGSVIHSRLSKGVSSYNEAKKTINKINKSKLKIIINNFQNQIMKDFLDFKKHFKFHSYYFSIATIQKSNHDERSLMINKKDRCISVLGGKIDTAIKAEEEIKKIIYE